MRWGCFGGLLGALMGLLLVIVFLLVIRPAEIVTGSATTPGSADITMFVSERTLSRIAAAEARRPIVLDFNSGGQLLVTTTTDLFGTQPVVEAVLSLQMQGQEVVTELHWVELGFLRVPPEWLPPEILTATADLGQTIKQQVPPDFELVGLTTTSAGLNLQFVYAPGIR